MNAGHARGLRLASTLNTTLYDKVLIDNCGVTEEEMEEIFAGFKELKVLKQLVIRRSKVGLGSIYYLTKIAEKIFPNNLVVLKIENCEISKQTTLALVRSLKGKSYIRILSLVRVSFDSNSIAEMCKILNERNYIEELDLSDNRLVPKLFLPLVEALSKCRTLKSINLSWNLLIEKGRPP